MAQYMAEGGDGGPQQHYGGGGRGMYDGRPGTVCLTLAVQHPSNSQKLSAAGQCWAAAGRRNHLCTNDSCTNDVVESVVGC